MSKECECLKHINNFEILWEKYRENIIKEFTKNKYRKKSNRKIIKIPMDIDKYTAFYWYMEVFRTKKEDTTL